jgi:hypothetical protein
MGRPNLIAYATPQNYKVVIISYPFDNPIIHVLMSMCSTYSQYTVGYLRGPSLYEEDGPKSGTVFPLKQGNYNIANDPKSTLQKPYLI